MVTWTATALGILLSLRHVVLTNNGVTFQVDELIPLSNGLTHATFVLHSDLPQDFPGSIVACKMRGKDPVEFELFESISHNGPRRFCGIAIAPERHANPVAKLGALMLVIGMQTNASN